MAPNLNNLSFLTPLGNMGERKNLLSTSKLELPHQEEMVRESQIAVHPHFLISRQQQKWKQMRLQRLNTGVLFLSMFSQYGRGNCA